MRDAPPRLGWWFRAARVVAIATTLVVATSCAASRQRPSSSAPEPTSPLYLASRPPAPAAAAADFAPATVQVGGGTISIRFTGQPALSREALVGWVEMAAGVVTKYYGEFPVKGVTVNVRAAPSGRIRNGTTYSGRLIRVDVGRATRQVDLDDDWLLVHEMFHLAFPDVDRRHHWMEEGLCVYLSTLR